MISQAAGACRRCAGEGDRRAADPRERNRQRQAGDQPDMALRLARYFGTSAEFWVGMQATYDLELARDQIGSDIEAQVDPRAA